jgi:hypothetical protein
LFDPSQLHLTDNFQLVDDIANAVAAQLFKTPQSHYTIGTTAGDVTDGFINLTADLPNVSSVDQCVGLVDALDKNVNLHTSTWRPGTEVVNQHGKLADLAVGTPIATFDGIHYASTDEHAAIYLGTDQEAGKPGIFVLDQFNLPPPSSGLTLYPAGTALMVGSYEPAEIRFIPATDLAAHHYWTIV